MKLLVLLVSVLACVILLTGCASISNAAKDIDAVKIPSVHDEVVVESVTQPSYFSEGSLWQGEDTWSLFRDNKAWRVGDIVLVNIYENTTAEKIAGTSIERTTDVDAGISNFFGLEDDVSDKIDIEHLVTASTSNKFSADASTKRSGKLTARISAIVRCIYPNGNMKIEGNQVVKVNNENQILTITGLVRASDISPLNTIDSPMVAESRIEYMGKGVLAENQKPGWLLRLCLWVWPF